LDTGLSIGLDWSFRTLLDLRFSLDLGFCVTNQLLQQKYSSVLHHASAKTLVFTDMVITESLVSFTYACSYFYERCH
jgi:hypothetical protein